jgi:cytochrome b
MPPEAATPPVRVWDLPTRLFHWLLAVAVATQVVTGLIGDELLAWHARLGYAIGALLLFRLVWGFAGGRWSRFASFLYGPRALGRYLRGRGLATDAVGHSPLGALSVFAMLLALLAQVASGLFSEREDFSGPLSGLVSAATVKLATRYHKQVGAPLILVLMGLHLAAIAYYQWRLRRDLVGPMWHGDKALGGGIASSRDDLRSRLAAAAVLGAAALLVWWIVRLGDG